MDDNLARRSRARARDPLESGPTMLARLRRLRRRTFGLLLIAAVLALPLAALAGRSLVLFAIGGPLRHAAAGRGLQASWRTLSLAGAFRVRVLGLAVTRAATGDTLFAADSLAVALDPWPLLVLAARPSRVELAHARLSAPAPVPGATDTLAVETPPARRATAERLRRTAEAMSRLMLVPARRLPELSLRDVTLQGATASDPEAGGTPTLAIRLLELAHSRARIRIDGSGRLALEQTVPFQLDLDYGHDDQLTGRLWFGVPDSTRRKVDTLTVRVDGRVSQDRRRGVLELHDPTRVWIGSLPLTIGGRIAGRGPHPRPPPGAARLTPGPI